MRSLSFGLFALIAFTSCSAAESEKAAKPITYVEAFPGLSLNRPVFLAEVPGKAGYFLALEQSGTVQIVSRQGAAWTKTPFSKITVSGGQAFGDERGLLGFAFHPDYSANGKYYVYFVRGSSNILAEGLADATRLKDSGQPLRTLLDIPDPFENHNGGTLAFGPKDKFLYLGLGDGGSGGDPEGNGQKLGALLGKFLRIDVDTRSDGKPYGIPADNPFVGNQEAAPEIWAYGLRNPWKWAFDTVTGDLWAGDVGQGRFEEVSLIEKGGNYGWNVFEGKECYPKGGSDCQLPNHKPPLFTYPRNSAGGISITGGVFYRGDPKSPYHETFLFGDYGSNNVWSLKKSGAAIALPKAPSIGISSFGMDSKGQVYVMGINSKKVYRMEGLGKP